MAKSYIFSSESVTEGHPDKVADTISDAVLDACLAQDKHSRVACETLVKSNLVVVAGEITTKADFDYNKVVRDAIEEIGYTEPGESFNADGVHIMNALTAQSPDIAQGVDEKAAEGKGHAEQGAGDQGLMFGFACNETPTPDAGADLLRARARRTPDQDLARRARSAGCAPTARRRSRSSTTATKIERIDAVVVSTQHRDTVKHKEIEAFIIENVIKDVLPKELLDAKTRYLVNPTGRFVIGGPEGDSGLTGRKIIVDTYGGMGRHGGGAFSGKDPSKVDRSAAYMGRYVAKNIVAAGLADRVRNPVRLRHRLSRAGLGAHRHVRHGQGRRRQDRRRGEAGLQLQAGEHRQAAQPAPPDLQQDDQLRPLRPHRQSRCADVGEDRQGRGFEESGRSLKSRLSYQPY